jgi:hypothetical protein
MHYLDWNILLYDQTEWQFNCQVKTNSEMFRQLKPQSQKLTEYLDSYCQEITFCQATDEYWGFLSSTVYIFIYAGNIVLLN